MKSNICFALLLAASLQGANVKIHPDLQGRAAGDEVRVIVQYKEDPGQAKRDRVAALGGRIHRELELVRGHAMSMRVADLDKLAEDPDVEAITLDHPVYTSLDTAAAAINASAAWVTGVTGSGVGVAVIDSGVSAHPDLDGRIVYNQDFTGEGQNADLFGHGTHVAGIIAGNGASSTGWNDIKTIKGIAPSVNIINLRALDSTGEGSDSTVIAAIQKAIWLKNTYNIRVINLSLGRAVTGSYQNDPLCQAVERAWKAGIVVVVSAGNYGRVNAGGVNGYGTITAPGNDPYVITVGAMKTMGTGSRADDQIATYSSKGPTLYDHIVKPDIVAPGNKIHSALTEDLTPTGLYMMYPSTQFPCSYYQINCGNGPSQTYYMLSGTSMAAPMVSAAAALLIAKNPGLSPALVKERLMKTAYKGFPASSTATIDGVTYTDYYDMFTVGAGYLDVQAALSNNDLAWGNSLSPAVAYNSTNDTGTLTFAPGSAFQDNTFGTAVIWGTNELNGTAVIWGTSTTWTNNTIWSASGPSAFAVIWGTGTTNSTAVIWGTNIEVGALDPLLAILITGE